MKKSKKIILVLLISFFLFPLFLVGTLYLSADMGQPHINLDTLQYQVQQADGYWQCKENFLRKNKSGLWEIYLQGAPEERGAAMGSLGRELMKYQEDVFVQQIRQFIPSDGYFKFLRGMIVIFNRNLGEYVPEEYRKEIYASSLFCTHEYDAIGSPYERQLNYHAAHDIGHAMQQYMLVGCSSFATWGDESADSTLVVGRNFDFYMGDDFARNKLVMFCRPEKGHPFACVGWPGMLGVVSGMNIEGLTVTINAAKGAIPTSAAMPISILAREILQYATTIDEAYAIAAKYKTFVSESLLIASARDKKAAVIEKTPEKMALYASEGNHLVCTNHYQAADFSTDEYNVENISGTDSKYRLDRLSQLVKLNIPLSVQKTVDILRDHQGLDDRNVGWGNEKTINQSIAHHSVVFKPQQLKMWVSTSPWQDGKFVCYDLKEIFGNPNFSTELAKEQESIEADSTFLKEGYRALLCYRAGVKEIKMAIRDGKVLDSNYILSFLKINPQHYYTHRLVGDYYLEMKQNAQAVRYYREALLKEIPYVSEKKEIEELVNKLL